MLKDIIAISGKPGLFKLMQSTYEKLEGKQAEVKKANAAELAAFMEQVLPNYDKDRVYASDMKKLFSWYNILLKHNILPLVEEAKEDTEKE